MSEYRHFDLAVIGSGSGNSIPDERFGDLKVALFEEHSPFGGTCLNVGCIPTKMFVYAAEVAQTIRESARYGIDSTIEKVRWTDIVDRVFGRIDPISAGGENYRETGSDNVTLFRGHASFVGPRTIDTGTGEVITADQVVVAAGSRPVVPQQVRESGVAFHTNEDVMRLPSLPEHLVILGSGYIASEFAHVFGSLGSKVSMVARKDNVLRGLDTDISNRFTELAQKNWDVHLNSGEALAVSEGNRVGLELRDGTRVLGDALLVAIGRVPNGDHIGAEAGGIELDDEGRVVVDEFGRTTAEGVFAVGDVSSEHQLKHVANHEARVVQYNLLQREWDDTSRFRAFDHRFVPAAVFTHPQIAVVGLTEDEALEAGLDITVKTQSYGDVAYGWAMEDREGFCKIIAERKTGRILGAHVMGAQAPTVLQPLIQAMSFGTTATEMARGQYWIHPGLPEVVENALLGLDI
ncbi:MULTISPECIES: mycothione reductase [Nocardiaceae]|jgi:mycothione reductase|uniref:mycothione reductase n=1 Tax=Nocardiaceae TaxID=85025 RepID=UPI001E4F39DB|nr:MULTISPECIES: mycothione reductase [Rhodococcus]MCC8926347.1 mycothione reductase [Rhodococcus sp. I2R]MCZ4274400.1 mycothione reductase [Rhodococcus yunnanensis]